MDKMVGRLARELLGKLGEDLESVLKLDELVDPIFMEVKRKVLSPTPSRLGSATAAADAQELISMMAVTYVLASFSESIGVPIECFVSPELASIVAEPNPEPIRRCLELPEPTDLPALLEVLRDRRSQIVERLVALSARLAGSGLSWYQIKTQESVVISHDDLMELLEGDFHAAKMIEIPFIREEAVSIIDRRAKRHVQAAPDVRSAQAEAKPTGPDHRERADSLQEEVNTLRSRIVALGHRKEDEESTAAQMRDLNRSLKARVRVLELAAERSRSAAAVPARPVEIPSSWDGLTQFIDEHLAGRVVLTPKAVRAAKASVFEDIPFAYRVLLMLGQDYVPMRWGEAGARERFEARCRDLRVSVGPTGVAADHRVTKAAYRAQHLGKAIHLDLHVQGSSSRDPRDGFRCYFAFIEGVDQEGYVLVGSLPSHLDSTHS